MDTPPPAEAPPSAGEGRSRSGAGPGRPRPCRAPVRAAVAAVGALPSAPAARPLERGGSRERRRHGGARRQGGVLRLGQHAGGHGGGGAARHRGGDKGPAVEAPLRRGGGPPHLRQGAGQAPQGVPRPRQDVHHRPADLPLGGGHPGDHRRGGQPAPGRRVLFPVENNPAPAPHLVRGHAGHAHRAAERPPPAPPDQRRQADAAGKDRSLRLPALLRRHCGGGRAERRETSPIHISLLLRPPGGAAGRVCDGWGLSRHRYSRRPERRLAGDCLVEQSNDYPGRYLPSTSLYHFFCSGSSSSFTEDGAQN